MVDSRLEEMCNKFVNGGYPSGLLQRQKKEAFKIYRREVMSKKVRRDPQDWIPFVSTYGSQSGKIANILRRHCSVLQQGCANVKSFETPPLMSYKRDENLRDKLVRTDIEPSKSEPTQRTLIPMKMGNFPCIHCSCCGNIVKGDKRFSHPYTEIKCNIKDRFTCSSDYVIYMLSCPCGLIYISEMTMEVRKWIIKHKSTICNKQTNILC